MIHCLRIFLILGFFLFFVTFNIPCFGQANRDIYISDTLKNSQKRKLIKESLPKYFYRSGQVVVDVWVNRSGNIVKAQVDTITSTTKDKELIIASIKAAMKSKFDTISSDLIQKSKITYSFTIK